MLGQGAWCSFPQRSHSSAIRKGSEEKFSYVVLQKKTRPGVAVKGGRAKNGEDEWLWSQEEMMSSTRDPTPLATLNRFLDHTGPNTDDLVEDLLEEVSDCCESFDCCNYCSNAYLMVDDRWTGTIIILLYFDKNTAD